MADEPFAEPVGKGFSDNPLYDSEKMMTAVEHSNRVTRTYGIEVMSTGLKTSPGMGGNTKVEKGGRVGVIFGET